MLTAGQESQASTPHIDGSTQIRGCRSVTSSTPAAKRPARALHPRSRSNPNQPARGVSRGLAPRTGHAHCPFGGESNGRAEPGFAMTGQPIPALYFTPPRPATGIYEKIALKSTIPAGFAPNRPKTPFFARNRPFPAGTGPNQPKLAPGRARASKSQKSPAVARGLQRQGKDGTQNVKNEGGVRRRFSESVSRFTGQNFTDTQGSGDSPEVCL